MMHGAVLVNDNMIGLWEVRRLTPLTDVGDEHEYEYEWYVEVKASRITVDAKRHWAKGRLTHRYSDGSVVLTAKVMQAAAEQGVGVA